MIHPFLKKLAQRPLLLALAVSLVALVPRAFGLHLGLTTDEAYHWIGYRSAEFLSAVGGGRFAETMITGHPGVTTMWLGSAGLLAERALQQVGLLQSPPTTAAHLILMRLPMALATSLAVGGGFLLLRRVVGTGVALLAALLWASDPFLVAHSRLLHLDALLTMLMLLATLALLAACYGPEGLHPRPRWPLLALAGLFSGLALLTKSLAALLAPIGALILLVWYWQRRRAAFGWSLHLLVSAALVWGGSTLLAALLFWPALWVVPAQAVASVVGEVLTNAGTPQKGNFLLGENYLTTAPGLLFYPLTLLSRLTPWVVVGLLALLFAGARRWPWLRAHRTPLLLLLAAALVVPLALTLPPKKFDRYALPAVPLLHVLAAAGLIWLGALLPRAGRRLAAGLTAATAALTLLVFQPYYLAYYNPLVGGSLLAPRLVPVGWGEGLDQAAFWLNAHADLERGAVGTWSPPTLEAYLAGQSTWQGAIQMGDLAHMVVYINQAQSDKESQYFGAVHAACTPRHVISLRGIDYAWIYRVPTYTPRLEAPSRLGEALRLEDAVLVPPAACSCAPHILTLVFEPLREPAQPLFLFLHVVDEQGTPAFQADLPLSSLVAADAWATGAQVPYTLELPLPPDVPSGMYRILVGLYDPASGERLPVQHDMGGAPPALAGPGTLGVGRFEVLADQRQGCGATEQEPSAR
jgi:4-amino-4-deoxy-L-arabinose transferase-like glycosyltransferase